MAERIQLRRTRGWRKPTGAVVVARPSRWGNPFPLERYRASRPEADDRALRALAVHDFRRLLAGVGDPALRAGYPSLDEIVADLAGRDLCCWCPLDGPCHADVLLELANGAPG